MTEELAGDQLTVGNLTAASSGANLLTTHWGVHTHDHSSPSGARPAGRWGEGAAGAHGPVVPPLPPPDPEDQGYQRGVRVVRPEEPGGDES